MKKVNELHVLLTGFILFLKKNFLLFYIALSKCFIYSRMKYLTFSTVYQFLSRRRRIGLRLFLFIRSTFKLNHAYLADLQYASYLLKENLVYSMFYKRTLYACKTSGFFFLLTFLVSSTPSTTTLILLANHCTTMQATWVRLPVEVISADLPQFSRAARPTQSSILLGSVIEYQIILGQTPGHQQ